MVVSKFKIKIGDIVAGISVAIVLVPQSIAYATLAGMPPIYGIYASIFPPIFAALFASSPYLQTGPVAMTSLLTFGALTALATPLSSDYLILAALLAIMVGVARIIIGLLKFGFIAYLMSQPVLTGFSSAAAVLIITSQLPMFFGVSPPDSGLISSAYYTIITFPDWSIPAMVLGILTFFIIIIGKKIHPVFPGILLAVILGLIYSHYTNYTAPVVGHLPSSFPPISFNIPWDSIDSLLLPSLVIALVGFAEPASIARTIATKNRQYWSVNREFISQGVANLASGLSGSFPVGGSFSRTMVNYKAGGRTRLSGVITGLIVLASLPVLSLLSELPRSILAAIIISAVCYLVDLRSIFNMLMTSRLQGLVASFTFILTIVLAPRIDLAVLAGIGLSIFVHLWRERRIKVISSYIGDTLTLTPIGVLFFGSAPSLSEALMFELAKHKDTQRLILDLRKVGRIDYTGALALQQVASDAERSGLEITIIPGLHLQGMLLLYRILGHDSLWIKRGKYRYSSDSILDKELY